VKIKIIQILKIIIPLSLGIFLIFWIYNNLSEEDKSNIFISLKSANYSWLGISFLIGILSHVFRAYRWMQLADQLQIKASFINSFGAVMIGYLANMAFPRLGEVTRCAILNRYEKISVEKALGTVIAERIIDLMVLASIGMSVFFWQYEKIALFVQENLLKPFEKKLNNSEADWKFFMLFIAAFSIIIISFLIYKKFNAFFLKLKTIFLGFTDGLKSVLKVKRPALFILQTLGIWACYILMLYVCFFCIPETSQVPFEGVMSSFLMGSIGIIFVQGGIGAYQWLVTETLAIYGITKVYGFALGWISWTSQTLMILLLGFIALIFLPSFNKKRQLKHEEN
jgi:uncharacterized protein (TIRG00374 family)